MTKDIPALLPLRAGTQPPRFRPATWDQSADQPVPVARRTIEEWILSTLLTL